MKRHLHESLSLKRLAGLVGLSPSHFLARFRREFGVPPSDYVWRLKISRAMELLKQPNASITQIAFNLGFSSSQHFATAFKRYAGINPARYRRHPDWVYLGPEHKLSVRRSQPTGS
jgi:AraC-like DNA-binding protein